MSPPNIFMGRLIMTLERVTLHTIRQNRLIAAGGLVVVAISGGTDSLALLHVLHQLAGTLGIQLHAATFDHQLRGEFSADDVRFVEETAQMWGIPVTSGRANVRQIAAAQGVGIEVAARQARYDFLARVVREVGASCAAVAHHADDQAETVLMHIIRGAGVEGLSGMALSSPMPGHPDIALIRPFLAVTRAQIEAYSHQHGLQPREDATNKDTAIPRNFIRWETLTHLETLNPSIRRALVQLADIARVEHDYIEQQLQQVVTRHVTILGERITLSRKVFGDLHPALQRRFIYWAAQHLGSADTGYVHIVAASEMGLRGNMGAVALLSGGLRLRIDYDTIVIESENPPKAASDSLRLDGQSKISVSIPGTTALADGTWLLNASTICEGSVNARLAVLEGSDVILRTRKEGDRFAPLGMGGHTQKLGRRMINRKIPEAIRDRVPLLVVNDQIAAILSGEAWPVSETFAVHADSPRIVYFMLQNARDEI